MAQLDPAQLRSRLAFDYDTVTRLRSRHLGPIEPFVSERAFARDATATPAEGAAGLVRLYRIHYRFPLLIGEGLTKPGSAAKFDLLAGGNYPFTAPTVTCLASPLPWSPHVNPYSGLVCLGGAWGAAGGRMLAAQLVVHVMRILNCDEPTPSADYGGWNLRAARYSREVLKARPLNSELDYPVLDAELTHGLAEEGSLFRALFAEVAAATFAPVASTDGFGEAPDGDSGFAPVG
jgi:hypothetical protein